MSDSPAGEQNAGASPTELDVVYEGLREMFWQGLCTKAIEWRREGDTAIAKFGYFEDAAGFVHGFLDSWKIFKTRDTEESIRLRGRVREEHLPTESMDDQVEFPARTLWDVPMEIKIPLAVINLAGLQALLSWERKQGMLPAKPAEAAAKVTQPESAPGN